MAAPPRSREAGDHRRAHSRPAGHGHAGLRRTRSAWPTRRAHRNEDGGFTLVEVVISLVLLSLVMSSMAVMLVAGLRNAAGLQRRQVAVTLGQQALEAARALSVTPDQSSCVKLLQGRLQMPTDQQWAGAPSGFTAVTDEVWASNLCSGPVLLPFQGLPGTAGTATDPVVVGGQSYTVQTYVGTCALATGRTGCVSSSSAPAGAPTLYRVLADVTWSGVGCDAATCDYTASTLLDTSSDPQFNVRGAAAPVAAADTVCLPSGGPGTIDIIANDTGSLGPSPVTVVAQPTKGTLASTIASGVGGYTPNSGASGTDSFTYYVSDVNGVLSNTVTVTITIGGC
jgi:type II secretory pathway pseudopilin PulG